MSDLATYRCTVTLVLEDVTEETANQFFFKGEEVHGYVNSTIYDAFIESHGKIERES